MSRDELDIIKNKIDSAISEIVDKHNLTIENDDYLISKKDFQSFKKELYSKLSTINDICCCQYYMETTYNLRVLQYNIRVNITQDNELIARYILPFTLTIKPEDPINKKEICKKLIDLDWSLPEVIYEINQAHDMDMQIEFRESLSSLTKKELDYLLSADFDERTFTNSYVKELYQINNDELSQSIWIPDAVKCAIKEAINDNYPIEAACYDWSKEIHCSKCYDFIINDYLNNNPGSKRNKLTNMYTDTLLTKL